MDPREDPSDHMETWGVRGLPEIEPGADLPAMIASAEPGLRDGDVVVVTSKVVSKAEGRLLRGPGRDPDELRDEAVSAETVRVVARRGRTRIVQTVHGFVLAAAGVDASNTPDGTVVLLPRDPDGSARAIRAGLRDRLGVSVAVVVSDTFGRPWRVGQTDVALGAAGLVVVDDHRGRVDSHGRTLEVTEIAIADEIAAATDLVKGKSTGTPVAVVRGLAAYVTEADGPGVRALVRPAELDMFSLGARDVLPARRTVREFDGEPVERAALLRAVAAAVTAPAPFGTTPWRFVVVETPDARDRLLHALAEHWRDAAGETESVPPHPESPPTRADSVEVLRRAPALVVACVDQGVVPDAAGTTDRELLTLSAGAAVQNLLVALAVEQLGSAWIAGPVYCPDATRAALDLPHTWAPVGAVAVGRPHKATTPRDDRPPEPFVVDR